MNFVTQLTCIKCGKSYKPLPDLYLCSHCREGGLLEVEYDYDMIKKKWSKEDLKESQVKGLWRYQPLLPINPSTPLPPLRVGGTPLYRSFQLARELGLESIIIKDDGLNPTGSLKDRASAIAVVKAKEAGASTIACSSTGNAASSLAGQVASLGGGMETVIFVPHRAPEGKVAQLLIYGATVVSVMGDYQKTYHLSAAAIDEWGWYNRNAAINPYLVEGKKTVVLEMAEELNFSLPSWLVFSVGDGCTIAGAWKALLDLKEIGFIKEVPRLLGVQAEGCAPITHSFYTGEPLIKVQEKTLADSIAVGDPRNYKKALRGIRASHGEMVNVSDEEILDMMSLLGRKMGIFGEPAGVAGLAGIRKMVEKGVIKPHEGVGFVVTGNGLKDVKNAKEFVSTSLITIKADLELLKNVFIKRGLIERKG